MVAPQSVARATVVSTLGTYTKMTTGELPSFVGARLGKVGHSASIMTISGPIRSSACATVPSGPGRSLSEIASRARMQKSTSAAGERQTSLGIMIEVFWGSGRSVVCMFTLQRSLGGGDCVPVSQLSHDTSGTTHHQADDARHGELQRYPLEVIDIHE